MSDRARSRFVMVDGIRTHYWELGEGPTVVLLHAGGYGENAWVSWRNNIEALAQAHRVVAPDWLGFGGTDKLRDFAQGNARMVTHMVRFFEVMCIDEADIMGFSMGGTFLVRMMASPRSALPARTIVLSSGGGFSPANAARETLLEYEGSVDGIRAHLRVLFHDQSLADDDEFVAPYHEASLEPGQWEFVSAGRFRAPFAPERGDFGNVDDTPYELIGVPTLVTAGAQDPLREAGYAAKIAARMPDAEFEVFDPCGHCPNVERATEWNRRVLEFIQRKRPSPSTS